jgi:hypothetical protein
VICDFWSGDVSLNLSICCMLRSLSLRGGGSSRPSQPRAGGDDGTDGVVMVGPRWALGEWTEGKKGGVLCFALPSLGWHLNMRDDAQLHSRGRAKSEWYKQYNRAAETPSRCGRSQELWIQARTRTLIFCCPQS